MVLIVGPRLDRPSAVGQSGRARTIGLGLATAAVVGYAVAAAELLGLWRPLQLAALGVGLVVAATALLDRETAGASIVGHLCFLPGGLLAIAGVLTALLAGLGAALLVAGFALALLGAGGAWADSLGRGRLATGLQGGALSVATVVGGFVVVPPSLAAAWLAWVVLESTVFPGDTPGVAGALFLLAIAAFAVRLALDRLPVAALAPRERRAVLIARRDRASRAATWLAIGGLVGWLAIGVAELVALVPPGGRVLGPIGGVTGTPTRLGLLSVAVLALLAAVALGLARRIAGLDDESARRLAPVAGGVGLLTIPVPVLAYLLVGLASVNLGVLLVVALAAAFVLVGAIIALAALALISGAARVGLLPDRAAPLALMGAGLLFVAVGAGAASAPAPVVLAGVVGALFAWDVSEFGLGLTQELGHLPDTRRVELLHGVAGIGVALGAALLAAALDWLVRVAALDGGVPTAMLLAVAGVVALIVALRG